MPLPQGKCFSVFLITCRIRSETFSTMCKVFGMCPQSPCSVSTVNSPTIAPYLRLSELFAFTPTARSCFLPLLRFVLKPCPNPECCHHKLPPPKFFVGPHSYNLEFKCHFQKFFLYSSHNPICLRQTPVIYTAIPLYIIMV